jgi:hypothetical protein
MKLLSKPSYIAAGVAAGIAGAVLFARHQSRQTSVVKRAGRLLVVGILGRRIVTNLITKLVKKTVMLKVCRMHLQGRKMANVNVTAAGSERPA